MFREILGWWLVVEAAGLIALPLAFVLFRRLPDRGYAFAKPLGILLGAYLFWLALTAHVLPNRPGSIVWCYIGLTIISGLVFRARREEIMTELRQRMGVIIAVEVIFIVGLFVAAYLRSFIPEIDGTEKPMDFMFINAASHSRYYPPADPWLAGFDVSYYYFGYVIQAMLGKLAAQSTAVTFNLGLASTAALAMSAAFGVGYNLVASSRRATLRMALAAGAAAAVLIAVMGNLEGVLEFARAQGIGSDGFFRSIGIANLADAAQSNTWYPTDSTSFWWWWRATRVCPDAGCIQEFPFFSFLLGDMHPHVMAIPFVLTVIGFGLALWHSEDPLRFETWNGNPAMLLLAGVLVGGLGFLNTWDLPAFGAVLVVLVLARNLRSEAFPAALASTGGYLLPLLAVAVIAYLPFYVTFHSQASGLNAVSNGATRPLHAMLIWLPLVLLTLPVPLVRVLRDSEARLGPRIWAVVLVPLSLFVLWALLLTADGGSLGDAISARGWNWLTVLLWAFGFCVSTLALWRVAEAPEEDESASGLTPMLALTAVAMLLLVGTELFFVQDRFGSRLNTVFKLYYQSWLLLACAGAFGIYWLAHEWATAPRTLGEFARGAWGGVAALAVLGALLYPLGATLSRTGGLAKTNRTLDGLASVRRNQPDELGAVIWLKTRAGQNESIAEAVLGSYSAAGRISARSGVPSVLGWPFHEIQWGRGTEVVTSRERDVNQAYSTDSLAEAVSILRKYRVTYVIVGNVERSKYPAQSLQKFSGLQAVYNNGVTAIYRLPLTEPPTRVETP